MLEPRVQDARRPAGEGAGEHRGGGGRPGGIAPDDQRRGDRRPERQRPVGRDVGEGEDPEADEHPERQERQDQPDRPRSDQERHGERRLPSDSERDVPEDPARERALAGPDDRPRVAEQVKDRLDPAGLEQV